MTEIVVALITGGVTLAGVLISNARHQALTDERIAELTREVRDHNQFARRMPVVEEKIKVLSTVWRIWKGGRHEGKALKARRGQKPCDADSDPDYGGAYLPARVPRGDAAPLLRGLRQRHHLFLHEKTGRSVKTC